ncbi:KilA-N domain-containing protein [Kingella kingae]|uniref:KilA-N domain-containing protein n=1 Tax=Kingella kingae TaxID=504 RepID=UPI00254A149E|nr:KilA-N domain-containing protein [Kingella kingae]MDK4545576.1 KilA-N domain-containing protein [Kingella kingae]MDK4587184.1 KilA-N domain-containing protein [Kingella kingae]
MNSISICNTSIRQFQGLFSLNDLHQASGGQDKHSPRRWIQNQQTIDFIAECEKDGNPSILKKQGLGTFVCKELVIHYAMWISPEFSLLVIQHFLNSLSQVQAASPHQNTVQTRKGLVAAVKQLAQSRGMDYSDAFRLVHHRFNVESIEQLSFAQIGEATEFVQRATLWGEVLDKQPALPHGSIVLSAHDLQCIEGFVAHVPYMLAYYHATETAVRSLNHNLAYRAHDRFSDGYLHALNLASRLNLPHKTWRDVAFELNR